MSRSFVAEIIGPAGAGKSTLSKLLRNKNNVRAGLSVWKLPLSLLGTSALWSLPDLFRFCLRRDQLNLDNLKLVIQHNALLRLINHEGSKGYSALILDEGSVFALTKLGVYRGQAMESSKYTQNLVSKVAPKLDAVIWLDAPDSVLAQRIRERNKNHRMKNKSDVEFQEHLSLCRNSFEEIVDALRKRNGRNFQILRFSTDKQPMEQIVESVLSQAGARV